MKKSIIAGIAIAVSLFAQADVLYWMVSDAIAETATSGGTSEFAALYVRDSSDPSSILSSNPYQLSVKTEDDVYNQYNNIGIGFEFAGIQAYNNSALSFYVEILSGEHKGKQSEMMSYAQLANYIIGGGASQQSSAFDPVGFGGATTAYNVPEPTSGLLFLIGGMLLGLKRRRQA